MQRWIVLLGATLGCAVGVGPLLYGTFGLYLKPVTEAFGWSRGDFALSFSLSSLSAIFVLPFVGYMIDRLGPRKCAAIGVVAFAFVYACFGLINSYSMYVVVSLIAGVVGMIGGVVTHIAFLPRWFDKRRGIAMGVASSGIALGNALLPFVITFTNSNWGWRSGFFVVAAISAVIGLFNVVFLLRENTGPLPEAEKRTSITEEDAGIPYIEALKTADFWRLSVGFALVVMIALGVNFHLSAMMTDRGYSPAQGAGAVALIATSALVARYIVGFLLDYMSARILGFMTFLGQGVAILLLILGTGELTPYIVAVLLGIAYGAEGDLLPFTLSRRFGNLAYGRLYTISYAVIAVAQLISPLLLGWSFDKLGSYTTVLWAFPFLSLIAAILVATSRVDRTLVSNASIVPDAKAA